MLKSFFGIFEVTEAQLQPGAIQRLRWGSYLSFLFLPAAAIGHFSDAVQDGVASVLTLSAFAIGFLGFCLMGFARTFNRLWTPDRYLDEGEIARKREVNSFAFFWVMTILMLILFAVVFLGVFDVSAPDMLLDSKTPIGIIMMVFLTALSLQGVKLSSLLRPMESETGAIARNRVDRYYGLFALLYILVVLASAFWL